MRKIKINLILLAVFLLPLVVLAEGLENYIIQNDIGGYKFRPNPTKRYYGNSGVIIGAGHFTLDHSDITYETEYILPEPILGVEVQVTQHAGVDSDRWLLHEVENGYRSSKELKATYNAPNPIRVINNNKIWFQWGAYRWLSNNVVVNIEYTDLQGIKPEPLEVVQAYLSKFPSTITITNDEVKGSAHNVQWIKDEMERRLWLCDKWSMQLQLGKVSQADMLEALVKNMTIFLKYRQKYFGVSKTDEEINLLSTYLQANDGTSIKAKLTEYKTWWNKNKGKSISLP